MEPEPKGIARTFYQTHLVGGMAGLLQDWPCMHGSRARAPR